MGWSSLVIGLDNHESLSHSVTYVSIELLGQLKSKISKTRKVQTQIQSQVRLQMRGNMGEKKAQHAISAKPSVKNLSGSQSCSYW